METPKRPDESDRSLTPSAQPCTTGPFIAPAFRGEQAPQSQSRGERKNEPSHDVGVLDHLGAFLGDFMVRKLFASQELLKASGTVTGKLVRWLSQHSYIDDQSAEDANDRAREASRDLPIADRLGMILHDLAANATLPYQRHNFVRLR